MESENDYPTEARADYVFGCMAANGQIAGERSLEMLLLHRRSSPSILTYDKYVQASTVLSMRQGIGNRARTNSNRPKMFDDKVADLRRAQAEAEIRCYRGGV